MKMLLIIFGILFIFSCHEDITANSKTDTTKVKQSALINGTSKDSYLCKINNEDWYYTKASGLVYIEKKTAIKKAIITFKKKLNRGNESIQLEYDVEKNILVRVLINIKRLDNEGKTISALYKATLKTISRIPATNLSGNIDLSNPNTASGTANFKVENNYEKKKIKNQEDLLIYVSGLNFSGISYSDLNKTFNK